MFIPLMTLLFSQMPQVDFAKSYVGKDGQTLDIVFLKPKESNQALLRVTRSDSAFDDLVFTATVKRTNGTDFSFRHRGGDYNLVTQRNDVTTVYVAFNKEFQVKFSETATKEFKPDSMLVVMEQQKNQLALLARKEWVFLEKKYSAKAQTLSESLSKKCKSETKITLNWATFPDEVMGEIDVWSLCAGLDQLDCSLVKSNKQLSCQLASKFAFETGVFSTTTEGAKQGASFLKGVK